MTLAREAKCFHMLISFFTIFGLGLVRTRIFYSFAIAHLDSSNADVSFIGVVELISRLATLGNVEGIP